MVTDVWIPMISCQKCGQAWHMKEEIQHDCSDQYECPDCDYTTVYPDGTEIRCGGNSGHGSRTSSGTAGAHGRLTRVSEILDPHQNDASTTPDDGSNTFQGQAWLTSWQSREVQGGVFTLTASFDSRTATRLQESLSGPDGEIVTGEPAFSLTIVRGERPST